MATVAVGGPVDDVAAEPYPQHLPTREAACTHRDGRDPQTLCCARSDAHLVRVVTRFGRQSVFEGKRVARALAGHRSGRLRATGNARHDARDRNRPDEMNSHDVPPARRITATPPRDWSNPTSLSDGLGRPCW